MRILLAAVAFSTLSFVAGVAGDLSSASTPVTSGQSVTLRIPPPIPANAPRAAPLPLLSTSAAEAAPTPRPPRQIAPVEDLAGAPELEIAVVEPKPRAEMLVAIAADKVGVEVPAKVKAPDYV